MMQKGFFKTKYGASPILGNELKLLLYILYIVSGLVFIYVPLKNIDINTKKYYYKMEPLDFGFNLFSQCIKYSPVLKWNSIRITYAIQ